MKLAVMEAMWHTEPPPAAITAIGIPDMETHTTRYAIDIPWLMGLIGTRSIDTPIPGIFELVAKTKDNIRNGLVAYDALQKLKANRADASARATFERTRGDLGYALLLKSQVADPLQATPAQIDAAAWSTVPSVPSIFFTFRFMVLFGFALLAVFLVSLWYTTRETDAPRWLLRLAILALPLPWLAAELGWFVAEFGRQPWIIDGVLPTFLATSELGVPDLVLTILGFTAVYAVLAVIEVKVMLQAIGKGPDTAAVGPDISGMPAAGGFGGPAVPAPAE
jgi:cytochrome d ubiquinol oxidase subunit I